MALKLFDKNEKIRESEEKFHKSFEYSPAPMSINDNENNNIFINCNYSFEKATGYKKEEILGKTPADLGFYADPRDREEILQILKDTGEVHNYKHNFRDKKGEISEKFLSIVKVKINNKIHLIVFQNNIDF